MPAVPAVAPANKVVVAVAELVPVLAGIAVVDMAALAVKPVFAGSAVVGLEPVEVAKVDVRCLEVAAVDTAAVKKGSDALVVEQIVGFDNRRKPRGQKPIPTEVVMAQIEVFVVELKDIAEGSYDVAVAGSQAAGCTLCL